MITFQVIGAGDARHHPTLADAQAILDNMTWGEIYIFCWLKPGESNGKGYTCELLATKRPALVSW